MILPATAENISQAAKRLWNGKLVAFPTETVYGLGANAFAPEAVQNIYTLKGRPSSNPLIVHVASRGDLRSVISSSISSRQQGWLDALSELWPAPLSLILPRNEQIAANVSGNRQTVAVRIPNHPVALELLKLAGCPIAAPSANRSNYVSPTTAKHVDDEFGDSLDCILDGGPCAVGIESTVVSLVHDIPTILRPGSITIAQLESLIGPVSQESYGQGPQESISPGMLAKHYAPKTPVRFFDQAPTPQPFGRIGLIRFGATEIGDIEDQFAIIRTLSIKWDLEEIAQNLYSALRDLDEQGLDLILVERCSREGLGVAIMDRLERATYQEVGIAKLGNLL